MRQTQRVRWLLGLLRPFRWLIFGTVLLSAATVLANVGLLSVSAVLISMAALQPPLLDLMVYIVGVRFFGISRALLRYSERYVSHKITFQILTALRTQVYERIEPVAPAGLQHYSDGQLFDRLLNDIDVLKYFYLRAVLAPAAALVVLVVCSVVLAQFSVGAMALLLGLFALFGLAVPVVLGKAAAGKTARLAAEREQWQILLEDYLGGLSELQNTGQQQRYAERLLERLTSMANLERWLGLCGNLTGSLITYGSNLSLVLALLVVIPAVAQDSLSGVYCAMVLLMIWSSFEAIQPFPQAMLQLQRSLEAAGHLLDLPERAEKRENGTENEAGSNAKNSARGAARWQQPARLDIRFDNISFAYEDGHVVCENFSLECPAGSRIALVGTSGSGKSTLVSLLVRFWEPQRGVITLGGIPLRQYPEAQLRQLIAVVEQDTFLFSATVRENLRLARPDATEQQLKQALAFAELADVVAALPHGLDTPLGDNGYRLSGGQRQRLALAQAWLRDCPIVVLDEVFQGLDVRTAGILQQRFHQWGQGRTMLYITHSLQHLQQMDCIYVLQQGQIVEQGTAQTLLAQRDSMFYQMWQLERQQIGTALAE